MVRDDVRTIDGVAVRPSPALSRAVDYSENLGAAASGLHTAPGAVGLALEERGGIRPNVVPPLTHGHWVVAARV